MLGNIQARRAVGDAPWTTNRGSADYLRTLARMAPSRSKNFRGRLAHAQQWPTRPRAISRFGSVPRSRRASLRRMVGVAAMLALHSEALSEVIFPLITSQRLLHADRNAPPLSR